MKKFLSLMLCLGLLVCLATTAYATGSTTNVSLEVPNETYKLNIPASVEINPRDKDGTITVSVEEINLIWSTGLRVYMTAQNAVSGEDGSYLVNAESDKKIHYSLKTSSDGDSYRTTEAFDILDTRLDHSATITLTVDGAYPGAGTYTDTLTFTVNAYTMPG